jgi:hypothetical protein
VLISSAARTDIYTFAGVSKDNDVAARIQHNVDLLRYLAGHPSFTKQDLTGYLDLCERFGLGDRAQRDTYLAADLTTAKSTELRRALAGTHLELITQCIKELGQGKPTMEMVKMIEFATVASQATKGAFV